MTVVLEEFGRFPCDDCWLSQGYKSSHKAIDLGWLNKYGANRPVKAWKSGVVVQAGQITETINGKKYYPTVVVLMHEDVDCVWITRYWHLVKGSTKVKKGDTVTQGQVLGTRGNTGLSYGVHLHFEIWKCPLGYTYKASGYSKYAVNPLLFTYVYDGQVISCDEAKPLPTEPLEPQTVERDTKKHQVEVIVGALRVRLKPSLKGDVYCHSKKGLFNVLDVATADGYTWYNVEADRWIATKEGSWTIDYPIELSEQEKIIAEMTKANETANAKIAELTAQIETLIASNSKFEDKIERITTICKE